MFVTKLIIEGNIRLELSGINYVSVDFNELIQHFLGMNGSGKTTLLREVSPMPIKPAHYRNNGYKQIEITANGGIQYVLTSRKVGKSVKNMFEVVGGTNLNPGGTSKVQKELVERILQFTPLLQRVLSGNLKFCTMDTGKRQEFLTAIGDCNLSFAHQVHDKLKQHARDKTGALKHVEAKLANTLSEYATVSENIGDAEREADQLHDIIKELLPHTVNHQIDLPGKRSRFKTSLERIDSLIVESQTTLMFLPKHHYKSYAELCAALGKYENSLAVEAADISRLTSELQHIKKLSDVLENTDQGLDTLEQRYAVLTETLKEKPELKVAYEVDLSRVKEDLILLQRQINTLHLNASDDMVVCDNAQYTEVYEAAAEAKRTYAEIGARKHEVTEQLHHIELALENATECPRCQFQIGLKEGQNPERQKALKEEQLKLATQEDIALTKVNEANDRAARCAMYVEHFNLILSTIRQYPSLTPLWGEFRSTRWVVNNPTEVHNRMSAEIELVELRLNYDRAQQEHIDLKNTIELYTHAQESNASVRLKHIEQELDQHYRKKQELDGLIDTTRKHIKLWTAATQKVTEVEGELLELTEALADAINGEVTDGIGEEVKRLQSRLGTIQSSLHKKQHLAELVKSIETDQTQLRMEHELLGQLTKMLSPKDGYIAEQMLGFVNHFVEQVNDVIGAVWEYELSLKPCTMDEKGLTYQFPTEVIIQEVPDISELSEGQQDIVNFAVTVVALDCINADDFPLYMDEVGNTFDYQHRLNLIRYIKQLLETKHCSQIFMVNHFATEYGGLTNAETLALTTDGVVLPAQYNKHATIRRG